MFDKIIMFGGVVFGATLFGGAVGAQFWDSTGAWIGAVTGMIIGAAIYYFDPKKESDL